MNPEPDRKLTGNFSSQQRPDHLGHRLFDDVGASDLVENLEGRFGRAFASDQEIEQVDPVGLLAPDVLRGATVLPGGQGGTVFLVDDLDAAVNGDLGDQFLPGGDGKIERDAQEP